MADISHPHEVLQHMQEEMLYIEGMINEEALEEELSFLFVTESESMDLYDCIDQECLDPMGEWIMNQQD